MESNDSSSNSETKIISLDSRRASKTAKYSISGGVVKVVAATSGVAQNNCANSDSIRDEVKRMERQTVSFLDALMPLMQRVISKLESVTIRSELIEQLTKDDPEGLFRDSTVRCVFIDECVHHTHLLCEDKALFEALCVQFKFPSSSVSKKASQVLRALPELTDWQLDHLSMLTYEMFLFNNGRRQTGSESGMARIFAQLDDTADFYERAEVSQREFGFLGLHEAIKAFAVGASRNYLRCMIEGTEPEQLLELFERSNLDLEKETESDTYTRFCAEVLKNSPHGAQIVFELIQPDLA